MSNTAVDEAPAEITSGWPIVSASAVGIGLGMSPLPFYTIGVFVGPISTEFGWQPSKVLLATAAYCIALFIVAPFIGMITDRIGARKVVLTSIVTFGLSMMLQSLHTGSFALYLFLWALIAVCGAGTLPITFTKAVNNWFNIHRGKALGITLVSTGVFGALAKFFAAEITMLYGWRVAYLALGMLPILIAFPMALVAFRDITDTPAIESRFMVFKLPILGISLLGMVWLGYYVISFILASVAVDGWKIQYLTGITFLVIIFIPLIMLVVGKISVEPTNELGTKRQSVPPIQELSGLTLAQVLKQWRFWMLAFCFLVISVSIGAVIPNLEQILVSKGFSITEAVGLAVLTGLAVLGGRVIGGVLIDHFWAPGVAFFFLSTPSIALYILSGQTVTTEMATLAIMMIGFGAGVEYDFLAYLVAKYFGLRHYASIYGVLYSFFGLGAGLGPALLSHFAESEGEWGKVLIYAAIALIIASLPLLTLGRYRNFAES
jgi:MFS family permease